MITAELQRKIDGSIRLLRAIQRAHEGEQIEIAYSGGKDSDVILQLAKEAGINYRAIYKNTTIDPPGTLAHVRAMGVEIRQPKRSFIEIVNAKGLPNRQHRFCCSELKEYKVLDVAVMAYAERRAANGLQDTKSRRSAVSTEARKYMWKPCILSSIGRWKMLGSLSSTETSRSRRCTTMSKGACI